MLCCVLVANVTLARPCSRCFARIQNKKKSVFAELDREQSLSTPRGGGELRSALPHFVRTHSCTHSSQPLPSPRHMASWSGQLTDLNGAGAGMQSKSQAYEHKTAAYMRTGCNAFKSNDSLPVCPLKVPTRLPLLRSWAVHAAYRSEFAQEIEAQQTPRYMNSNPHTAQAFGVAPAPRPIHTGPATPRNRAFQVCLVRHVPLS